MAQNFSDPIFIKALKEGDALAIRSLVSAYNEHLVNAAYGQGLQQEEVEDIVQSTWQAFFEGLARFQGKSHIRTYLFGILYNKLKELWRSQKRYQEVDSEEQLDAMMDDYFKEDGHWKTPLTAPERALWPKQIKEHLDLCLDGLQEKYRMAFYLKEIEEEDSKAICNMMNVSRTNLGVLLFRAKNLLRVCLEGRLFSKADI